MKRPSLQWYPGDWLSAADVRACSVAARGLWMDMLSLMHAGEPYGHLTMNGKVVLPAILARITGATVEQVEEWLGELEGMGVFSRTEEGVIYCRRMIRDEQLRQVRAAGGFKALDNPNVPKPKLAEPIPSTYTSEGIPPTNTSDPSPSSSSSSSTSEEQEEKRSRSQSSRSRRSNLCDEEFLADLQGKEAYRSIDVRRLYAKMIVWCEQKRKQPTRMRLINWLNREDVPMTSQAQTATATARPMVV